MYSHILVALAVSLASGPLASADTTIAIDAASDRGTWEGWGTSLAWWAAAFGDRDDLADIFFTLNDTEFRGQTLPGLGFNIARHNAGACSWNEIDGESMIVSPNMIPSRQIEGHWLDWKSDDPSSSSWDWSVDAKQREMLIKARDRGANRLELFSNSPMWWMCKNHNPSGSSDGSENIQEWNLRQHAVYLATIAKYATDNWGITFESVEPFNEPSAGWWTADNTQEGCHIGVSSQATIIGHLRSELDDRGLTDMIVSASDESYYDEAVATWRGLGEEALSMVPRINVHGYQQADGARDVLYDLASGAGQKIWNSEYGENDATGELLVRNLLLDFRWLRPVAWQYWQVLDGGGWGLIDADNDEGWLGDVSTKYFVLAQFSRHIREGMRILDGGAGNVVAAYDEEGEKLVIVAVNWDAAQEISFDLSGFGQVADGARVTSWRTQTGGGDQYVQGEDREVRGSVFSASFETGQVQTFEVEGVLL
ncbi:hypothetical protein VUR80DRAFT_1899 [Thermomyces stellatus]